MKYAVMHWSNRLVLIITMVLPLFLTSCNDESIQETDGKVYYDLKGFIDTQITELDSLRPRVRKKVSMGDEHHVIETRDINWEKELGLFVQADINKPAFKQSYSVSRRDSSTYVYVSKEGERLPVRELKIVLDKTGELETVEAYIRSENKLYVSEKRISLQVADNRIQNYSITGFQQLVMMDKKPFSVSATISN